MTVGCGLTRLKLENTDSFHVPMQNRLPWLAFEFTLFLGVGQNCCDIYSFFLNIVAKINTYKPWFCYSFIEKLFQYFLFSRRAGKILLPRYFFTFWCEKSLYIPHRIGEWKERQFQNNPILWLWQVVVIFSYLVMNLIYDFSKICCVMGQFFLPIFRNQTTFHRAW